MTRLQFQGGPASLSERSRKAFQLAHQEAHRLNHPAVGIEHLLLGLAKEGQSAASTLLHDLGFGLTWLRVQVERVSPPASGIGVRPGPLPYRPDLAAFLADVIEAGNRAGVLPLTPEHLLLALVNDPGGGAVRYLCERRLALWQLRRRLLRLSSR